MWVVSKIIGDGLTPETAYRTAAQQYGLHILNADAIPVDPNTGRPTSDFAMIEIEDKDAKHLASEAGCYVLPKTVNDKQAIAEKLLAQGCVVDLAEVSTPESLSAVVLQKVAADKVAGRK